MSKLILLLFFSGVDGVLHNGQKHFCRKYDKVFGFYSIRVSVWLDSRLAIIYQKSFTETNVKIRFFSASREHYLDGAELFFNNCVVEETAFIHFL